MGGTIGPSLRLPRSFDMARSAAGLCLIIACFKPQWELIDLASFWQCFGEVKVEYIFKVYEVSRLLHFEKQKQLQEFAQARESQVVETTSGKSWQKGKKILRSMFKRKQPQTRLIFSGFDYLAACEASVFWWGTFSLPRRFYVNKWEWLNFWHVSYISTATQCRCYPSGTPMNPIMWEEQFQQI